MPNTVDVNTTDPATTPLHRAGNVERFPSGQTIYLAPLPLPTDALPHSPYVSDLNDTYLDFGGGKPQVFSWQVTLGGPFTAAFLMVAGIPLVAALMLLPSGFETTEVLDFVKDVFLAVVGPAICMFLLGLSICLVVWIHNHNKYTKVIPTRFNRQRREVCFMPTGAESPTFVPWESLSAWVVQAQGATQYGVHRQYAMGMGYQQDGQQLSVEFMCAGLPLAIAHWEAVRAFMEYEVHDLKRIQDPMDLQGPDDPRHEGLHTFRNARARLHRMIREKEKGWVYGFFWYLFHVMTFWTLPNRLVEWEVRRIEKVGRRTLPEAMRSWSEPLPQAQWAKPSEELMRLSKEVKVLKARTPLRSITDIFAEVCQGGKATENSRSR
ncbi:MULTISPECIES: hypothetical protein [Pseudomonas syringae group]|uniref:hypothetical protein n=1 Tax=Pseudomonas syringae group TaxID=136849 RepID=UPI001981B15A|nr:hypothetical protein [Pseudomonas viridiflava]